MIRIALIGDIGSGKTHVSRKFNYPVFNADNEVSKLYNKSRKCYNKFKKNFPKYITKFPIEKKQLSKVILANQNNLKKIIKIVHPEIRNQMNKFLKKNKKRKVVVLDIPLLIENKINKRGDILIFIDAEKKEINKRLKRRNNINMELIKKFKKLQLPVEIKKKKANFVIKNNFNNNFVKKSVRNILNNILLND
jgi:dephospho-CoA kinase